MSRFAPALLIAAGAAALSACAPSTATTDVGPRESGERRCLFQDQIQSFRVAQDARTVYVQGGDRSVYKLEAAGACRDLDNAMGLAFLPQGGLTRLCTGDWTQVVPSGATPPVMPCRLRIVSVLTEAERAALPARDRP